MKNHIFTLLTLLIVFGCENSESYADYVDTSIGTGGHGHVFVGASVPFGMVQLGPTSIPQQWDWCSGYHESDSTVIGFSHTHLSGTGIGDLFDITVMPVTGEVTYNRGDGEDPGTGLWSYADRSREISRPGYYSVPLVRYGITAEMTASARAGFHRYTFPTFIRICSPSFVSKDARAYRSIIFDSSLHIFFSFLMISNSENGLENSA